MQGNGAAGVNTLSICTRVTSHLYRPHTDLPQRCFRKQDWSSGLFRRSSRGALDDDVTRRLIRGTARSPPPKRVAPSKVRVAASAFCLGASGPFQRPLLMVKCALKIEMIEVLEKPGSTRSEGPPFVHLANQKFPLCVCVCCRHRRHCS